MLKNFSYLLLIRLFSLAGIVAVFIYIDFLTSSSLPLIPIGIVISIILLATIWSWLKLRKEKTISKTVFFLQLLIDIIGLSLLIYFSGGSANPLISLFIIPVIFSAASLTRRYTWALAVITIGCYTGLMFFQVPLGDNHHHDEAVNLHLWGMWYGFILSVVLIAYFVSRISYNLRKQEHLLALARESTLRDEQVIALGTLAANTAHELGTPLSTMAILTNELENDYSNKDEMLVKDLSLLRSQIDRCKSIIAKMAEDAGELRAESGEKIALKHYLDELIDNWASGLTDIDVSKKYMRHEQGPDIVMDQSLSYAFINILKNSGEATKSKVAIEIDWDDNTFTIVIKDNGEGIEPAVLTKIGNNIVSGSGIENGMGIGLFLAKTTINRFGGDLFISSNNKGTCVSICIPLCPLLTVS